jgi:amino-acid N-acetyltransferase
MLTGEGQTDAQTLELATEVTALVSLSIMQGLTRNGLRCALSNGVRSKEIGIVKGEDHLYSGRVDKLDIALFDSLLKANTIPIITPIAFNREGTSLRINSDLLAAELAAQLDASKLIYMTTQDGLSLDGQPLTNLPVAELGNLLQNENSGISERLHSKRSTQSKRLKQACLAPTYSTVACSAPS